MKKLGAILLCAACVAASFASRKEAIKEDKRRPPRTRDKGPEYAPVKAITITKKVPVPYPVEVEKKVPVAVKFIVKKPYMVYIHKPYPVTVREKVPIPVPILRPYPVEKKVPVPVKVTVEKQVPYPVDRPYPVFVEKKIPYPVEKRVPVPVEVVVDNPVPVHVPIDKPIPYPIARPVPVPVPVPYPIERKVPVTFEKPIFVPYKTFRGSPEEPPLFAPANVTSASGKQSDFNNSDGRRGYDPEARYSRVSSSSVTNGRTVSFHSHVNHMT